MKLLKKILGLLAKAYFIILFPSPSYHKLVLSRLSPSEKFHKAFEMPITIVGGFILVYVFKNFDYKMFVISLIIYRILTSYFSTFSSFGFIKKPQFLIQEISNSIFDIMFFVIVLDFLYQHNYYQSLKNFDLKGIYIFLFFVAYLIVFFASTILRRSILRVWPDLIGFVGNKELLLRIINFIFFIIYIAIIFSLIYYVFYLFDNNCFNVKTNLIFFDAFKYSISILFNSPISELKPQAFSLTIVVIIESILAYLFLVIFIAHLFDRYKKEPQKNKDKYQYIDRKYNNRRFQNTGTYLRRQIKDK